MVEIHGNVEPGFENVREAFERNFRERDELGAAVAVYHRGQKVVDLWAGIRDKDSGTPWEEDTMVVVFSTTKGMSALAIAVAHSRGLIDYDERVATYWPEFAQNGKEQVTVRQLLGHQAGLCAIDTLLTADILADMDQLRAILARQKPAWEPGTRHGYHAWSMGWYASALLHSVDPQKRTIGQYFADELAKPLGLDFYIGLPDDVPSSRLATTTSDFHALQIVVHLRKLPFRFILSVANPRSLTARSFSNPPNFNYNDRSLQRIEVPAANGIGTARSIARAYSEFVTGGKTLGLRQETLDALYAPATPPTDSTFDQIIRVEGVEYSLGFMRPVPLVRSGLDGRFGSDDWRSFGHAGAGGSFGFADPTAEIGFAYVMNRSDFYIFADPREKSLRDAVYESLAKM